MAKHIQSQSMVEAELDLEIRALQAGKGRRGRNASQSNGCCFEAVLFPHLSALQVTKIFEVPHQPAPVIVVHVPRGQSAAERAEQSRLGAPRYSQASFNTEATPKLQLQHFVEEENPPEPTRA